MRMWDHQKSLSLKQMCRNTNRLCYFGGQLAFCSVFNPKTKYLFTTSSTNFSPGYASQRVENIGSRNPTPMIAISTLFVITRTWRQQDHLQWVHRSIPGSTIRPWSTTQNYKEKSCHVLEATERKCECVLPSEGGKSGSRRHVT